MKRVSLFILLFAVCAVPHDARANMSPPLWPPGANLQPGEENTRVRMMAETVLIEVQDDRTPESLGSAAVTADFTMRNLGDADERMMARFPISSPTYPGSKNPFTMLTGLVITVDEREVRILNGLFPDVRFPDEIVPWAEFDVEFPVGKDVHVRVRYDMQARGWQRFGVYDYVLETGAGWKGTIGSADIILRLPYPASTQNVVMGEGSQWPSTTPGAVFDGTDVRWRFEDFEPGPGGTVQNMFFNLVAPSTWRLIMEARSAVAVAPNDGEAWGRLGMTYKSTQFSGPISSRGLDPGGEELFDLALQAYERCLQLLPYDAQWHAGFAELLAFRQAFYWQEIRPELYRALEEIQTALKLAPDDATVRRIAGFISDRFPEAMVSRGGSYDFAWLTQTPTPGPIFTVAAPATPSLPGLLPLSAETPTHAPAIADTPTPSPAPAAPARGCGSLALVPVAIVLWAVRKRRL